MTCPSVHTTSHTISAISGLSHEATFRHGNLLLLLSGRQHLDRKSQHFSFKADTSTWQASDQRPEQQDNINFKSRNYLLTKPCNVYDSNGNYFYTPHCIKGNVFVALRDKIQKILASTCQHRKHKQYKYKNININKMQRLNTGSIQYICKLTIIHTTQTNRNQLNQNVNTETQ